MNLTLPNEILSPQDLRALIIDVEKYAKWFGQTSVKMKYDHDLQVEQLVLASPATQVITDWAAGRDLTQVRLDELIIYLKDLEEATPTMTITLVAPASNGLKRELVDWCRQNIEPSILVNFRFNSTILGGMVVSYGSHIYDWSFRRRIIAAKEKFPEVLRNV